MKTKRKPKPDLYLALHALLDNIDDGVEYPDAHCHVVRLFGLTVREGETLTQMYDEYCGEGK